MFAFVIELGSQFLHESPLSSNYYIQPCLVVFFSEAKTVLWATALTIATLQPYHSWEMWAWPQATS